MRPRAASQGRRRERVEGPSAPTVHEDRRHEGSDRVRVQDGEHGTPMFGDERSREAHRVAMSACTTSIGSGVSRLGYVPGQFTGAVVPVGSGGLRSVGTSVLTGRADRPPDGDGVGSETDPRRGSARPARSTRRLRAARRRAGPSTTTTIAR